ncbi:MAG: GDYXXLXY domain-containing protein, partial [Leptospiraceae bacterium]|nr:GDYXXLXY domain-containing protein [Leptospiraceae bacterium]
MNSRKYLLFSLIIPILALLFLTFYKAYILSFGLKFVLPITGYDPRDLLSGHFVTYNVEYGMENPCGDLSRGSKHCICLHKDISKNYVVKNCNSSELSSCTAFIKGVCKTSRFEAGIEKYFIPEDKAAYYDKT